MSTNPNQHLIDAGVIDEFGNLLIDPITGAAIQPPRRRTGNDNHAPGVTNRAGMTDPVPVPTPGGNGDPLRNLLIYPNGSTDQDEDDIKEIRDAIYAESQKTYQSLLDFQKQQAAYQAQLTEELRRMREFGIPKLPDQSGRVVVGGSASKERVGISDLLIRY